MHGVKHLLLYIQDVKHHEQHPKIKYLTLEIFKGEQIPVSYKGLPIARQAIVTRQQIKRGKPC